MSHVRGRMLWKVPLIGLGLIAVALGVTLALTDAAPARLPLRAWRWVVDRTRPAPAPRTATARPAADEPPFSDIAFDDSGYATAIRFSEPITDSSSLARIRDSVVGRGERGIAYLENKLASLPPSDPATASTTANIQLLIGSLLMYDGRWEEAGGAFARAQAADPGRSTLARANMDALPGVAALRRGEIENCVACCNESSCIFPLAASAVHRRTAGSREAIEHFTRYLRQRPEDLGVRWLLNVAYMTLGEYPDRVPPDFFLPLGRFAVAGDSPARMVNVASRVGLNTRGESMAGGCLVDDFDGDGLLDVFMPTTDPERGALLLRNRGDGRFEDISDAAGLAEWVVSLNAVHADYDNDGRLDILMLRGAWEFPRRMTLLRNGGGRFEDVTLAAGLGEPIASQAAGWADFDNDGHVDPYVAGELGARLTRRSGDGPNPPRGGSVRVDAGVGVESVRSILPVPFKVSWFLLIVPW